MVTRSLILWRFPEHQPRCGMKVSRHQAGRVLHAKVGLGEPCRAAMSSFGFAPPSFVSFFFFYIPYCNQVHLLSLTPRIVPRTVHHSTIVLYCTGDRQV